MSFFQKEDIAIVVTIGGSNDNFSCVNPITNNQFRHTFEVHTESYKIYLTIEDSKSKHFNNVNFVNYNDIEYVSNNVSHMPKWF